MNLILIVDDEPGVLQTFGDWLESDGYEVASAGSAEEAMAWFRQTNRFPDAALLDIKLPGANGFELADWLFKDFDFDDVIFLTAFFWEEETRQELVNRRRPYFEKPLKFTREVLPFLRRYIGENQG
ncbi:MAG: response regulator [Deltaproteobacteria bacterium]|nr:response regulator [Deltaproteobacteria bacterium]